MIQANTLIAGAAAIALSLGATGQGTIPKELQVPLGNKDISSKTKLSHRSANPTLPSSNRQRWAKLTASRVAARETRRRAALKG